MGGNIGNKAAKVDSICFNSINKVLDPAGEFGRGRGRRDTDHQMSKVLFSRYTTLQATPTSHITERGKVLEEMHECCGRLKQGEMDKPPGRDDIVRRAFQLAGETKAGLSSPACGQLS